MSRSWLTEMELAADLAWTAGRMTLRHYQTGVIAELKDDESPVTAADREAEVFIREGLQAACPDDGIVGEECEPTGSRSGRRWYVDPIDGTKSFVSGVPLFGVLVGLEGPGGTSLAGAVYLPALDELVCAARGEGCFWNGRRARVSTVNRLADAAICYTSARSFAECGRQAAWEAISSRARLERGWGDCYGHVLVATGRADAMLDPVMSPWDCGPLPVILEEAGGSFTDWRGDVTIHGGDAVSTNGSLREQLLGHLRE